MTCLSANAMITLLVFTAMIVLLFIALTVLVWSVYHMRASLRVRLNETRRVGAIPFVTLVISPTGEVTIANTVNAPERSPPERRTRTTE